MAVAITLLTTMPVRAQGISYAWWVKATFEPREEMVEGVPLRDIDRKWLRASALRAADLPAEAAEKGETPEAYGFALALEADLDGDGSLERAVVGVFQTRSGEVGRFLLILGRSGPTAPWTKRALFSETGAAGFSALAMKNTTLLWVTCFECDTGCGVVYRWWRFRLQCYSCC